MPFELDPTDLRDALFDELNRLATEDGDVIILADDQGAFALEWAQANLPGQYYNIGIAEQNLISVSAGLAMGGKRPFVYGIATFMTLRCYEQIRNDLCAMQLPVTIIASGPGYTYAYDGPTHHATEDVAIMRALPGMTIFSPADAVSTRAVARLTHQAASPSYVRIEKGTLPRLYSDDHDFSAGFARLLEGDDIDIVASGAMVHRAVEVAETLGMQGVKVGVVDLYRLKPVDGPALLDEITRADRIATLEEHSVVGGLGSLVAELIADAQVQAPLLRLGLNDEFVYKYGDRDWMREQGGLDASALVSRIASWQGKGA